jgi:hypothetical protein
MKDIKVYIDDICIFAQSDENAFELQDEGLRRLEDNGFTVNPFKCKWMIQETDWCWGHWLTPEGLKPWKKKVDAILRLQLPDSVKQIRSFIGSVNYY